MRLTGEGRRGRREGEQGNGQAQRLHSASSFFDGARAESSSLLGKTVLIFKCLGQSGSWIPGGGGVPPPPGAFQLSSIILMIPEKSLPPPPRCSAKRV